MSEIWILGATGRTGRAAAVQMASAGFNTVLVGRDEARLRDIAARIGNRTRTIVAGTVEEIVRELGRNTPPAVVLNTIGPFAKTAVPIAQACPPGTHYVDISNELFSVSALLALHDEAASSARSFVSGAGFGVLGTESVVLKLCEGMPPAQSVRVDAVPMFESEPGRLGDALAASLVDSVAAGGYSYVGGKLEREALFGRPEDFTLPDGRRVHTGSVPSGDLAAAHRASGAPIATAGSSMAPRSPIVRAIIAAAAALLRIRPVGDLAKRRIAAIESKPKAADEPKAPSVSWTRARVQWASGVSRVGFMRTGDSMPFTVNVMSAVTMKLARGEGRPGAFTPGALFGPDLAIEAGGQFFLDDALDGYLHSG